VRKIASFILLSLIALSTASAQTEDVYLESKLDLLHQKLDAYLLSAPIDQKLKRMELTHYWLHALAAYSNLGTLSIYDKMSKLDEKELADYNKLESQINSFTATPQPNLNIKDSALQFISSLTVLKNQFILYATKPVYFFEGQNSPITITFYGSFPALLGDTAAIYLYNGSKKVPYSYATDTSLTFTLTPSQLGLDSTELLAATNVKLHLVGQLGRKINPKKQFTAIYDFYAMALPASPGKLTITKNSMAKNIEKQTKRTRTFLLNGSKGNLVEKQCVPNHDGWTLVSESVELVVEISKGQKNRDWSYRKTSSGGKICYTAEVFFNNSGTSGKLEYHLKYDIMRNKTEETSDTSEMVLTWGERQQLNFDQPVTEIIFTDFMGNQTIIADASFESFWLQLKQEANYLNIKTPDLSSLNNQH
jgi:hypothetical protein